jgi:hypothetical protein
LAWSNVPAGTLSFAVTIHDPDAPRPGGWWHWVVFDIPATATGLPSGPGGRGLPAGAKAARNDFGEAGYGGPCPPPGKPHRYVAAVWALSVEHLRGDASSSSAEMARQIQASALAKSEIVGLYGR